MPESNEEWSTAKTAVVWVLQVLLGLAFLASGGFKLIGDPSMVELFDNVGVGQWFRYVTGIWEVGGALMLFHPSTAWVGGGLIVCAMVGAVATHVFIVGGSFIAPLVLLILAGLVVWFRRP